MSNDVILLVSRVFLTALFLVSGLGMLAGPAAMAGYFGALGIPFPGLVVWLVIALKLVAGVAVLVGLRTRWAAYAIAAFSAAAALIAHSHFSDQNAVTQFLKDFAIAGGFLLLSITGPGAYSLDARRGAPVPA